MVRQGNERALCPFAETLTGGARYVLINRMIAGMNANYVGVDNEEIGYLAATMRMPACRRLARRYHEVFPKVVIWI